MFNRFIYTHVNLKDLFIIRKEITCFSSSLFPSRSDVDPGQQMKILNQKKQFKQAIDLFNREKQKNTKQLSSLTIQQALKACIQLRDVQRGQDIHHLIQNRLKTDSSLVKSLIHFYMQCHDVKSAEALYNMSTEKTLYIYGTMMKGYIENQMSEKAIDLFKHANNPDEVLITLLFNACAQLPSEQSLNLVKNIWKKYHTTSLLNNHALTSLTDALMKCGDVKNAEVVFDKSPNKILPMYGAMIKGYIKNQMPEKAIDLFKHVNNPDAVLITLLFNACAQLPSEQSLILVKNIWKQYQSTYLRNNHVLTSLIDALMKCGDVKNAEVVFNTSPNKVSPMYGAMMTGYIKNQMSEKAIDLFKQVNNPSEVMIILLFKACAQLPSEQSLNLVKNIWKKYQSTSLLNNHALTSLINALMKCGDVEKAESIFNVRKEKTLEMYGTMMKGFIENNMPQKAIHFFHLIEKPDSITTLLLFNACAQLPSKESLNLVNKILIEMPRNYFSNMNFVSSLIDVLMKCGDAEKAESIFNLAEQKTLEMFGAMMKGYITNQMPEKAIDLFKQIKNPSEVMITLLFNACAQLPSEQSLNLIKNIWKQYQSTSVLSNHALTSLIDALMRCGDVKNAEVVFNKSPNKVSPMYGAMMKGYLVNEMPSNTLHLYHQIKNNKSTQSNVIIYLLAINALSQVAIASECQSIVDEIPQHIFSNDKISNALIDMWGKVGCVEKAEQVFNRLSSIDRIGYTSMINTYGINGMGLKAVKLFDQVPQSLIGDSTYVSVLNACSHSGLVDKARSIFTNIEMKTEKNYITMIDCLSRGSFFDEAQQLIDQYEQNHSPSPVMYMSLLSGARNQKNKDLAEKIYQNMKKLFPQLSNLLTPAAILLANVYASSGELEKAFSVRNQLSKSGAKKKPGLSWTAVNGEIYRFHAHDRSHPRSSDIHLESEKISQELILHGHEYDSTWITRPLGEDETIESVLCGHSERLAIAWNFVVNPNAKIIQITKNLRICGDCHQATKLIAAIRQCEIVIRDANRIHHFDKNGRCSCNDYF